METDTRHGAAPPVFIVALGTMFIGGMVAGYCIGNIPQPERPRVVDCQLDNAICDGGKCCNACGCEQ